MWSWQRGDYGKIVARRRAEAEQAAAFLNITLVGWSDRPARFLWQEMSAVFEEIKKAITANAIDQVWLPAYEGGNPDHDALNAIGQKLKSNVSILEFAEYNYSGGKAHSNQFPHPNGMEQVIDLSSAERAAKQAALQLYKSEKANLNYVRTERECYRVLADYDYNQPPHPGTLWYARFRWVPFRHPRVDFTDPADVSKAVSNFGVRGNKNDERNNRHDYDISTVTS
jgi:LmbE family N-acetylglucosaminyl deacetylase